jgi:hypothetical protein
MSGTAPVDPATPREIALRKALADALVNLMGAASAYATFAGCVGKNSRMPRRDALYGTRTADFQAAVERGKAAYRKLFDAPGEVADPRLDPPEPAVDERRRYPPQQNPMIPEAVLVRHRGALKGDIAVGEVLAWEPDIPTARELIVVTGLTGPDHLKQIEVPHGGGLAVLTVRRGEGVFTRPMGRDAPVCWSDISRFREACMRTLYKPVKAKGSTADCLRPPLPFTYPPTGR